METLRRENQRLQARLTEIAIRKASSSGTCSTDDSLWCSEDSKSADTDNSQMERTDSIPLFVSNPYSTPQLSVSYLNDSIRASTWDDGIQCKSSPRSHQDPSNAQDRDAVPKHEHTNPSSSVASREVGQSVRSRQEDENRRVMELVVRAVLEDKQADLSRSNCYQVLHKYAMAQVEIQRKTTELKLANLRISKMKREEICRMLVDPSAEATFSNAEPSTSEGCHDKVSVAVQTANHAISFTRKEVEHENVRQCELDDIDDDEKQPTRQYRTIAAQGQTEVGRTDPFGDLIYELIWAIAFTFCLINLLHGPGAKKNVDKKEQRRRR